MRGDRPMPILELTYKDFLFSTDFNPVTPYFVLTGCAPPEFYR